MTWDGRTWAGVGVDDSDSLLASAVLEEALLCAVVAGTGQSSEVEEDWDLLAFGSLWWEIEVELHLAIGRCCLVGKLE